MGARGPKPGPYTERVDTSVTPVVASALRMIADLANTSTTDVARRVISDHLVCAGLLTEEEAR